MPQAFFKLKKSLSGWKIFLIFILIFSWIFSGWPQIFNFPSEVREARADTQAINIQRGVINVPNTGITTAPGTNFGSLASAFVLFKSNRSSSAGLSTPTAATRYVDDLSMRLELTAVDTITATRISTGEAADYRADWESWEYVGASGGANEFIVRSRNTITLGAGTRSTSESLDNMPTSINKSIPFITGISNTQTGDDSNGLTAIAWISGTSTLNIERGGSLGTTIVQVVTVEFTGSNWSVAHGKQAASTADTGTMTLYEGADAATTAYTISSTTNAFIAASQSRGDTNDTDDAISDNWPATYISSQTQVAWEYDAGHAVTNGNLQYVHVLENPYVTVTRFTNTGALGGDNNVDITSAGVTDLTNTAIFLSKRSSGTGNAFPRGWASYRITSTINAAHWVSYSGNTQSARLEIVIMPMEAAPAPVYEQSGYRWFNNNNGTQVGATTTATQDASSTLSSAGAQFRLRMVLDVTAASAPAGTGSSSVLKLQFSSSTPGGCDAAYSGETYVDVETSSGYIRFYDNSTPLDGQTLTSTSSDPVHNGSGHSVTNQTYEETNNFNVTSTIAINSDGRWDFSLVDSLAPAGTTFCFRAVYPWGDLIATSTATKIPEIKTASAAGQLQLIQRDYRWYQNTSDITPTSSLASENNEVTLVSTSSAVRLRMNVTASSTALATTTEQFKLQFQQGTTTGSWTDITDGWWNRLWRNRRKITFSGVTTTEAMTNFSVLVSLSTSSNINYAKTQNGGEDIRFVNADGTTILNHEIEKWDENGTSTVWVKVPNVATSTTDFIWMYYNNPSATSTATSTGVWTNSYRGVWHLSESGSCAMTFYDSTANALNGTCYGAPLATSTNKTDGGRYFDGSDDGVSIPSFTLGTNFSYEAIIRNPLTQTDWDVMVTDAAASPVRWLGISDGNQLDWYDGTDNNFGSALTADTWYYVAVTYDGSNIRMYNNGSQVGSPLARSYTSVTDGFAIARKGSNGDNFLGEIDEVRISTSSRSAAWLVNQYKSLNLTLNTYSGEETATWLFYDNAGLASSTEISQTVLLNSEVGETYEEKNPVTLNPKAISANSEGEWDFALDPIGAATTTYYFRMVISDDSALDDYSNYPKLTISVTTISCSANISATSFGTFSPSAVSTSTPNASTTMTCADAAAGCTLYIKNAGSGSNPGLWNSTLSSLIKSPNAAYSATTTLSAGTEGYGIRATTTATGSGTALSLALRYNTGLADGLGGSINAVGGLSLSDLTLASTTAATTNREVVVTHKAAISAATLAGTYNDTITYSCLAN